MLKDLYETRIDYTLASESKANKGHKELIAHIFVGRQEICFEVKNSTETIDCGKSLNKAIEEYEKMPLS